MVLAFLKAEIDSERFVEYVLACVDDVRLIHEPDLTDAFANERRRQTLKCYRGYQSNDRLFAGFPAEVDWCLLAVTIAELATFRYARVPPWTDGSGVAMLVRDGASNVMNMPHGPGKGTVLGIEQALHAGSLALGSLQPIIATAESVDGPYVLLEGHSRATAYARACGQDETLDLIVGYSTDVSGWAWFNRLPPQAPPTPTQT